MSDNVEKAARLLKVVRLARNPMMDVVSIKLNSEPTRDEILQMRRAALALEWAAKKRGVFDMAEDFNNELDRIR